MKFDMGLLFVVFLVLKLCKVIDWSWWWVTAPLWGTLIFIIVIVFVAVLIKTIQENRND